MPPRRSLQFKAVPLVSLVIATGGASIREYSGSAQRIRLLRSKTRRNCGSRLQIMSLWKSSISGNTRLPEAFLGLALEYLDSAEELPVLLRDLEKELIIRFGPTDAGWLWLVLEKGGTLLSRWNENLIRFY